MGFKEWLELDEDWKKNMLMAGALGVAAVNGGRLWNAVNKPPPAPAKPAATAHVPKSSQSMTRRAVYQDKQGGTVYEFICHGMSPEAAKRECENTVMKELIAQQGGMNYQKTPTGHETTYKGNVRGLFSKVSVENGAVIVKVTHNPQAAKQMADEMQSFRPVR